MSGENIVNNIAASDIEALSFEHHAARLVV